MNDRITKGVTTEKTADGWLVTVTEGGVVTHRRIHSDKAKAIAFETEHKRRLGFIK